MHHTFCLCLIAMLLVSSLTYAQDKICNTWYTDGKTSAVQIYKAIDNKYYGKIVWLKEGMVDGKPLIDKKNPEENKRTQTWLGMQILSGLIKKSPIEYVTGKIYDPTKGNYYNCKMTIGENNTLKLRGYILGIPFLGRTTTWSLKEEEKKPISPQNLKPISNVN